MRFCCVSPASLGLCSRAQLDDQGHLRLSDFGLGHQLVPEKNYQISGQAGQTSGEGGRRTSELTKRG